MDAITAARELGKAIQASEEYKAYDIAKKENDEDAELQNLIGDFNLTRTGLQLEMQKPEAEKNNDKIAEMNKAMQDKYTAVMGNVHMANFVIVKNALDKMLNDVNTIIGMCCEGENPDTCEIASSSCTGSCSTCGGCH